VQPLVRTFTLEDVEDLGDQLSGWSIEPVQLSPGGLRLGFATLGFEDVAISRIECNQQVADHLCMDPSWLLVIIQLTPQRWDSHEAPPSSLVLIAPGSDYRSMVFDGFRCVEVAVRVDLAEELGFGPWYRLTGARAILPLPPMTTRFAERWVSELLCRSSTNTLLGLSDDTAEALRERCVEFLCYLKETISASMTVQKGLEARLRIDRFDLAEAALRVIDATPVHENSHPWTALPESLVRRGECS